MRNLYKVITEQELEDQVDEAKLIFGQWCIDNDVEPMPKDDQ
jgi:hypothetical protein